MTIGLLELLLISYAYGIINFMHDLKTMTQWSPGFITSSNFTSLITTICPIIVSCLIMNEFYSLLIDSERLSIGDYRYPSYEKLIGAFLIFIPFSVIPICAIRQWLKIIRRMSTTNFRESFLISLQANEAYYENARNQHQLKD